MLKRLSSHSLKSIYLLSLLILTSVIPESAQAQFVKGADIGWLPQMEATGFKFYDSTGLQKDCIQILKDKGINTIRLRVWVNPSNDKINGHCSKNETVAMALRAKAMGMRVMIDFHYSDTWADPGKQTKPAAWASHSFAQLLDDVYNHTYDVLDSLKQSGVTPEWAQIGNEIAGGMLWPDGSSGNFTQLAQLLNKGYDAAKAVDSSIKVVIHLESGNDNSKFRWFFDNAKNKGVRYDIIGMSYYPYWIGSDYTTSINSLQNNMNDMAARYNKDVMVVEVGGIDTQVQNTYDMLLAVIAKTLAVPGNRGLGVIYWEPEGARIWSGYQLSCWRSDGKPTAALNAFLKNTSGVGIPENPTDTNFNFYPNPSKGGILNFEFNNESGYRQLNIYDSNGKLKKQENVTGKSDYSMSLDLSPGIYFVNLYTSNNSEIRKLVIW